MMSRVVKPAAIQFCRSCKSGRVMANRTFYSKVTPASEYATGRNRSNAEQLIAKVPVIMVKGSTAVCDGGGGALGHPIEYIDLMDSTIHPTVCKYCGLRYQMAEGRHDNHH